MTITTLPPSPAGEITHGTVRSKVNELVDESNLAIGLTTVLSGFHNLDQGPVSLDTAHQILFGDTLGVNIFNISGDVILDTAGALTCVTTGPYIVLFTATYGRDSPSGTARVNVRVLVNGTQVGGSGDQWSSNADARVTKTTTFVLPLVAGDVMTAEIVRNSADSGANDGGLFSNAVAAAGWADVPSAIMSLFKIEKG